MLVDQRPAVWRTTLSDPEMKSVKGQRSTWISNLVINPFLQSCFRLVPSDEDAYAAGIR